MREIKLRAWVESEKSLVDVLSIDFKEKTVRLPIQTSVIADYWWDETTWNFEDVILMQYTGLKDVNGKEIYEGDILYALDNNDELEEFVGEVLFDEAGRFVTEGFPFVTSKDCFVKGNIYENSELLGVKNNV